MPLRERLGAAARAAVPTRVRRPSPRFRRHTAPRVLFPCPPGGPCPGHSPVRQDVRHAKPQRRRHERAPGTARRAAHRSGRGRGGRQRALRRPGGALGAAGRRSAHARTRRRAGHDRDVRPRHGAEDPLLRMGLVPRRHLAVHARLLLRHSAPLSGTWLRRRSRAVLRPPERRYAVPGVPRADRGVHAGGGLADADARQRPHPAARADVLDGQRGHADDLRGGHRRVHRPHAPASPLGRSAGRAGTRVRSHRDHQLGSAGRRADGRGDAHVVPGPGARLRDPHRPGHGRQALPRPAARPAPGALLAGGPVARVRDGAAGRGRGLAGGEPAGDDLRPRGVAEVLHSARSGRSTSARSG
ncbi:hypothetical protein SBADM41S_00995 [Streptomyces badius]